MMDYPDAQLYTTLVISIAVVGLTVSVSEGKKANLISLPIVLVGLSWIHLFISFVLAFHKKESYLTMDFLLHFVNLGLILSCFIVISSAFLGRRYEDVGE